MRENVALEHVPRTAELLVSDLVSPSCGGGSNAVIITVVVAVAAALGTFDLNTAPTSRREAVLPNKPKIDQRIKATILQQKYKYVATTTATNNMLPKVSVFTHGTYI